MVLRRRGRGSEFTVHSGRGSEFRDDRHDLRLFGEVYILYANSEAILSGPLRNYNPSGLPAPLDPYNNPSFLFLGDDTTSADSHVLLGVVTVPADPVPNLSMCDFNNDPLCNVADLNSMLAQGDLALGVMLGAVDEHDLDDDLDIDNDDIDRWLEQSASINGYRSAFLRGDSDGLSSTWPNTRDVDDDDFDMLFANYEPLGDGDPTNGPFWNDGNFNGDDDVDISDFNFVAGNFSPVGYGGQSALTAVAIPEPTVLLLAGSGLLVIVWSRRRKA